MDTDGNGVDDRCQTDVVADPSAAASAEAAVDENGDGTISVSEAAHSGRTGGANCNHGGYVSSVAKAQCGTAQPTTAPTAAATTDESSAGASDESSQGDEHDGDSGDPTDTADAGDCTADAASTPQPAATGTAVPTCDAAPAATDGSTGAESPTPEDGAAPNHGALVSAVAQSDAVGGKNCNHGGAVSQAAHDANQAAKDARAAAKALRDAERAAAKAARDAARHAKHHGKPG